MESKILISCDELSYNSELVKLNSIAQRYFDLSMETPKGCNGIFNDYLTNSHQYLEDFAKYCDDAIDLPISVGKKMVMIDDNYMKFKNDLDRLHQDMISNQLNLKDIGKEGQITPIAKDKLKERFNTYVEGDNIKLYKLMKDCESKLNELNIALQESNRVQIFMYSQWHPKTFKRAGSEILFDVNAILY